MKEDSQKQRLSPLQDSAEHLLSFVQTSTKISYLLFSRIFVFTTIGLIITGILAVFLYPELRSLFTAFELSTPVLLKTALLTLIVIGAPVIYFIFAKTHGLQVALCYTIRHHKSALTEFAVQKFFETLQQNEEFMQAVQQSRLQERGNTILKVYNQRIKTLAWPTRSILQFMIRRMKIPGLIYETIDEHDVTELNLAALQQMSAAKVNKFIDDTFSPPQIWSFVRLVGVHLALFFLLKYYL